jgi:pimeloyl-ACP methyl ester carboxylesterase
VAELNEARRLIPGRTDLVAVNGAGHELTRSLDAQLAAIVQAFARVRSG